MKIKIDLITKMQYNYIPFLYYVLSGISDKGGFIKWKSGIAFWKLLGLLFAEGLE